MHELIPRIQTSNRARTLLRGPHGVHMSRGPPRGILTYDSHVLDLGCRSVALCKREDKHVLSRKAL